jgi:aspartyl-tRNA(Asn)/glutamyl-tRNA(Gln) amidotransferase subunit C
MSINGSQVENIALLARLKIAPEAMESTVSAFSSILNLVDEMQAIDTTDVMPLANPLDQVQRLRTDVVSEVNQRDYFQANAPATEAGLYLVPKVIE